MSVTPVEELKLTAAEVRLIQLLRTDPSILPLVVTRKQLAALAHVLQNTPLTPMYSQHMNVVLANTHELLRGDAEERDAAGVVEEEIDPTLFIPNGRSEG